MALLSVRDLCIRFHTRNGIIDAVDHVSFDLEPGRTLGIVGESGSGKSVACHSLMGLLPCPPARIEGGHALFDGQDLLNMPESGLRTIRGNRIAMIFQDPLSSLNPYLTVGRQLQEVLQVHRSMDRRSARHCSLQALDEVGIADAARRIDAYPHEFSGGMRQRVMIAMALLCEPDVLIADEPTTALDVTIQAQILDLISRVQAERRIALIFISHNLGVIAGIADEVLVMQRGRCVEKSPVEDIFYRPREAYTKALLESIPTTAKPGSPAQSAVTTPEVDPLLRITDLAVSYGPDDGMRRGPALAGVSLELCKGEILGLVGESGSGKSTLARAVLRLVDVRAGSIRLGALPLSDLHGEALRHARPAVQMVFQDPYSSLNPRMTVHACLAEALQARAPVPRDRLEQRISDLLRAVELDPGTARKYPHEFSGGQRQRIAIARALAPEPALIIADEAVSALDVTIQAQILDLVLRLNREHGLTLLFISHDLSVIRHVCDRTAVLLDGKLVEIGPTEELFSHPRHAYTQSLLAAIPIPDPVRERQRLARRAPAFHAP